MGSDLVSAEEARGLLAGARGPFSLWLPEPDGDWRIVAHDTPMKRRRVVAKCGYAKEEAAMLAAAPNLARTVVALSEERDEARRERDRLRDILACERGERAPEEWVRDSKFDHNWSNPRTDMRVDEIEPGRWQAYRWSGQHDLPVGDVMPTALESIEAADRAAGEVRGG